jgi:serine/threonine protein kinase
LQSRYVHCQTKSFTLRFSANGVFGGFSTLDIRGLQSPQGDPNRQSKGRDERAQAKALAKDGTVALTSNQSLARDRPSGLVLDLNVVLFAVPSGKPGGLRPEERLLLDLADGRSSVREVLRRSGLAASVTMRALRSLCERGLLQPVTPGPGQNENRAFNGSVTLIRFEPTLPTDGLGATGSGLATEPWPVESPGMGRYEVIVRIAQGGSASVYLCRCAGATGLQRLCALKVIREHSADVDAVARLFLREAEVGRLLKHPNLRAVLDVGQYQGQPFLLLDYVEGASLADLLRPRQRCSPSLVLPIILDVLRGLQHLHDLLDEHGTPLFPAHGDVSPENILVGSEGVARLSDFGSVEFGEARTPSARDPGLRPLAMRKPAYLAPELLEGAAIDARSDLFALGVVLWTALTGRPLFAGASYEETVTNVFCKRVPPPSAFGGPRWLDDLCLQALTRKPAGRFHSAAEMASALIAIGARRGLLPGEHRVGSWVRETHAGVLSARRQRLQAIDRGDVAPTIVHSEGPMRFGSPNPPVLRPAALAPTQILRVAGALGEGRSTSSVPGPSPRSDQTSPSHVEQPSGEAASFWRRLCWPFGRRGDHADRDADA